MTRQTARARGKTDSIPAPVTTPRIVAPLFNLPAADQIKENDTPRSLFTKARVIKLLGAVSQEMADTAIAELFYYEAMSPGTPITMLINSGGGAVSQGWAIIDAMNMISSPVHTCAIGRVASMGTTILLAGAKGHRSATPNTYIMMHEPYNNPGVSGQTDDVMISAQELEHTKARMLAFYAMTTGTPSKVLAKKMGRDYYMYPAEALELGVIDKIAGYPDSKAAFNAAARKSNVAHLAMHNPKKNGPEPE